MALSARTHGRCDFIDGRFYLNDVPAHISMRLKQVFAQIPKTTTKDFVLNTNTETCVDLLWFFDRFPFEISGPAERRLAAGRQDFNEREEASALILGDQWQPEHAPAFLPDRQPYGYQQRAADLGNAMGALLVMDELGLGKTITALAAVAREGRLPAAVVVEPHLAEQWIDEFVAPFTNLRAHLIKGTSPYELPQADIYVFRYSNIHGWVDVAGSGLFRSAVFDEVQQLRTGSLTRKGAAALTFRRNVDMCIALTATPIYNYGDEAHAILDMVAPGSLGSYWEFVTEWCRSHGGRWVVADPPALGAYLREANLAIRRTEDDAEVSAQIPPVHRYVHHVDYDAAVIEDVEAEAQALALRMYEGRFHERGQAARELDLMMRRVTGLAKARHVAAYVRMLVASGEKVLLSGWHRDVYDTWLDALSDIDTVMYTGSESTAKKQKAKRAFIEGDAQVMIISNRSGAGLDGLQTVCCNVVIGELDWSPQVHKQLIGRVRRPGQTRDVLATYCTTNGGSDPPMVEMLGLKSSQAHGIVDPFAPIPEAKEVEQTRMKALAEAVLGNAGTKL
jgi:hypothetical protein